ncbi:hypothetical protein AKJ64_01375 [candidate division MSBL1 archaeon SCGC-AAA259E17]|uniref:Uncharacterized protein n=1 Tax=candidate division MSBL1 archaeon SCGC-AAA259E17 TaxID=1698263 RepID=A0A133UFZ6_9EURY|nr:hypothetical protein AKJ64_01375 [candidate division MSBL1 archaeon SCGC-AAA259E17]
MKTPGPEPHFPPTPEETWNEIERLLKLGYDDPARLRTINENHYIYMNKNGREKLAGKVTPRFWSGELEDRKFRSRYYTWKGEAKRGGESNEFTRIEWTKEKTGQKRRHDLLTP